MPICNYVTSKEDLSLLHNLHSLGLTEEEKPMPYITDEPKTPIFFCRPKKSVSSLCVDAHGKGFDLDEGKSRIKAVAELLERICLLNPNKEKLIATKYSTSKLNLLDPAKLCCYSNSQINREEFNLCSRETEFSWYQSYDLFTKKDVYLPAQIIFLSDFSKEPPIRREQISTGAAFGLEDDLEGIIRRGLFEAVERDACMFSHLSNKRLPKIVNAPQEIQVIKEYVERYNLEVHLLDATTQLGIPTVICATIDRTGIGDAVSLGSSSEETYSKAMKKSILESIQCRRAGRTDDILNPSYKTRNISSSEIKSVDDRYLYCKPLGRINDLSYLLDSDKSVDYAEIKQREKSYNEIILSLKNSGLSIFVSDITLDSMSAKGFKTIKVTIPELLPLYISEDAKALYSDLHGSITDDSRGRTHLFT